MTTTCFETERIQHALSALHGLSRHPDQRNNCDIVRAKLNITHLVRVGGVDACAIR